MTPSKPIQRSAAQAGFTLLEVVVATGILATSLIMLLEMHYGTLNLAADAHQIAIEDMLLQRTINYAESETLVGNKTGKGDFGELYPGYAYRYHSTELDRERLNGLYEVVVKLDTPSEEVRRTFYIYFGSKDRDKDD